MKTNNRIPADIESFEDSIDKISPNYLKNGQYNISKEKYPFDSSEDKKDYVVRFHINDNELIEEKKNINGYLRCTVSVNNRVANKEVTDNFFLDFKPKRDRQADGRDCYKQFKVNIRQR